ncbi:MAG: holo-ACP synthase [Firmicutes bacterium]|nr:holo-ACP synthase [Bacillota bacterium]
MEVKNTGIDVIGVERVRKVIEARGERFLRRVLSPRESAEIGVVPGTPLTPGAVGKAAPRVAARFAAKEAVLKAIGSGLSGLCWRDIEILRRGGEAPRVELSGRAAEIARSRGIDRILVSMSHDRDVAVAQAVAQGE